MLLLDGLLEINVHSEALKVCLKNNIDWLDDIIVDADDTTWLRWASRRTLKMKKGHCQPMSTDVVPEFRVSVPSKSKRNVKKRAPAVKHSQKKFMIEHRERPAIPAGNFTNSHEYPLIARNNSLMFTNSQKNEIITSPLCDSSDQNMSLNVDPNPMSEQDAHNEDDNKFSSELSQDLLENADSQRMSPLPVTFSDTENNSNAEIFRNNSFRNQMDSSGISHPPRSPDLSKVSSSEHNALLDIRIKSEPPQYETDEYDNCNEYDGFYQESVPETNGQIADMGAFMNTMVTDHLNSHHVNRNDTHFTDVERNYRKKSKSTRTTTNRITIPRDGKEFPKAQVCLKCQYCNKIYSSKSTYLRHQIIHTGEKPFSCPHCNYRCNRQDNIRKHIQAVHNKYNIT